MNAERRYHNRVSHERWLVSYADFITLMFAFFVVMFASARIDKERTAQLTEAIQSAFQELGMNAPGKGAGATPQPSHEHKANLDALARTPVTKSGLAEANHNSEDFAAMQKELEKLLSPEIKRREVALRMDADGIVISLREIGFFDSGSAQIKPQATAAVHRIASFLQARNCSLRIEGHTDNVPIHTASFASNWELSTARATTLVKLLIEGEGFSPERLSAAGYGEYHPFAENSSTAGQQMNRRVDIVVVPQAVPPAQLASAAAQTRSETPQTSR